MTFMGVALLGAYTAQGAHAFENAASAPAANKMSITPHRAVYRMKMGPSRNGSAVSDVAGKMVFEWRDMCDSWATQQRLQLHFNYADGDDQELISSELATETKDGKSYSFNVRRTTGGQEPEAYRGKAAKNADGTVTVSSTSPEPKTMELPAGTLFPTEHTILILQKAVEGEQFFSRRVFDGSDEDGSNDISAFISPRRDKSKEPGTAKLKKNPLLSGASWPIHLAFFKIVTETGEPDYEMDMNLLPNGVAQHMKVDYGEFSVLGTLEEVQALRPQNCP
jgi:hypothetical protein